MDTPHLTAREQQIAARLLHYDSRKVIAVRLHIEIRTVDFHLANLRRKLRVHCLAELTITVSKLNGSLHKSAA